MSNEISWSIDTQRKKGVKKENKIKITGGILNYFLLLLGGLLGGGLLGSLLGGLLGGGLLTGGLLGDLLGGGLLDGLLGDLLGGGLLGGGLLGNLGLGSSDLLGSDLGVLSHF